MREDTPFAFSISKKPPRVYADFLGRARNYINAEASTSKKSVSSKASCGNPERDRRKEMKRPVEGPVDSNRQHRDEKRPRDSGSGMVAARTRRPRYDRYQELTATIEEIFVSSRSEVDFRPPALLKGKVPEKHKDKFCLYHNAARHTTATMLRPKG